MQKLKLIPSTRSVAWLAVSLGLAMLLSAMVVTRLAAQGSSDGLIRACRHEVSSVIIIVDANESCPTGWSLITWNTKGEQGLQGPPGNAGPQGPAGDSHWRLSGSATYYNAGNVGIGTTNPAAELHILGDSGRLVPPLKIESANSETNATIDLENDQDISAQIIVSRSGLGTERNGELIIRHMESNKPIIFELGVGGEKMRIVSTGVYVQGKGTFTGGIDVQGKGTFPGGIDVQGKATFTDGVDPPFISFSNETHESIREYAQDVESQEKVMQFWNGKAHRMEVYVIDEDQFYTITGELIDE